MPLNEYYKKLATSPFGFPLAAEDVKLLEKSLEDDPELEYFKEFSAGYEYCIDGERSDVSVITDNSLDEQNEIIDIKSLNWDSYRKNPIVAFNHNYGIPPIGKSIWQKQVGDKIKAKTIYVPRPESYPKDKEWFPDSVFEMIKKGFLPGKSIGGVGKIRKPTEDELKIHPLLKAVRYNGKVFEYSVVPRQANNNAIVEAVSKGLLVLGNDTLDSSFPEVVDIIKSLRPEKIVITNYQTEEDYLKSLNSNVENAISDVQKRTPEIVDACLARILGRV